MSELPQFVKIRGGPSIAVKHIVTVEIQPADHYSEDRLVTIETVLGRQHHTVCTKSQAEQLQELFAPHTFDLNS
jgi:hypothetical protein